MTVRTGIGFDAHRFAPDRPLILGGVRLEHPLGLAGHSDADVLCHAIADAILGAVADGDIGVHFPDTDPRWKGACSIDLLRTVGDRARGQGAAIAHVDATVLAEAPRLRPHVAAMRERIAGALGLEVSAVSVKATTVERMGALGREEGIAVMAIATVET